MWWVNHYFWWLNHACWWIWCLSHQQMAASLVPLLGLQAERAASGAESPREGAISMSPFKMRKLGDTRSPFKMGRHSPEKMVDVHRQCVNSFVVFLVRIRIQSQFLFFAMPTIYIYIYFYCLKPPTTLNRVKFSGKSADTQIHADTVNGILLEWLLVVIVLLVVPSQYPQDFSKDSSVTSGWTVDISVALAASHDLPCRFWTKFRSSTNFTTIVFGTSHKWWWYRFQQNNEQIPWKDLGQMTKNHWIDEALDKNSWWPLAVVAVLSLKPFT